MSKETIAVDIDEVLFPMAPTFLVYHNTVHGTDLSLDQMTSYYIEELTGETEEQMLAKIDEYLKTEHYTEGQPIQGSIDAIHRMREKYNFVLITSRTPSYRGSTEAFIEAHFSGLFDELRYTHAEDDPHLLTPKEAICRELGAIALIDDSLSNVKAAAMAGIQGVLFGNYRWNQTDQLPDGVARCHDWPEVEAFFNARS